LKSHLIHKILVPNKITFKLNVRYP